MKISKAAQPPEGPAALNIKLWNLSLNARHSGVSTITN
jgi:hypothetical protein